MDTTNNAQQPTGEGETTEGGFIDELVAIRRIRALVAKTEPEARERVLAYVVQAEQSDRTKLHRATLDRLTKAGGNFGAGHAVAGAYQPEN